MSDVESSVDPSPGDSVAPFFTAPDSAEPRVVGRRLVLALVVGAVGADLALRYPPWNNVATSLAVVAVVAALLFSGRFQPRSARAALVLAAVVGSFLWVRSNPTLVSFNVMAVLALAWYAAVHSRGQSLWDTSPVRLLVRAAESVVIGVETISESASEVMVRQRRVRADGRLAGDVAGGVMRGVIIAVPIVIVFGLLLTSADAVFASFFNLGVSPDLDSLVGHPILLGLGAFATLVLLRVAGRDLSNGDGELGVPRLGLVETLVVLVSLDLLFAGFGIAQLIALSGGAERVLADAGLTLKEYARQGFFQLLWVAALSAVVLIVLDVVSRHLERGRRAVKVASLVAVGLTLIIVVVAYSRLRLYISYDGHTPLRFYSSVFSLWIGVVFVILALRIGGLGADRRWLTSAVGLSAVVFLIGLNAGNPEAIIANENLDRGDGQILFHMEKLSADGNVVLADGIDRLPPEVRHDVISQYCSDFRISERRGEHLGLELNLSEWRLDERFERLCSPG